MQVNTVWVAPLARITGMTEAAVTTRLTDDACFNIAAAAAIVRYHLTDTNGDLMAAIGRYHSHTPALGMAYQQKVLAKARAMFRTPIKD
jgi:soluble lytic murein transglycosylase-like protein